MFKTKSNLIIKLLCLLLATVTVLSCFVACDEEEEPDETVKPSVTANEEDEDQKLAAEMLASISAEEAKWVNPNTNDNEFNILYFDEDGTNKAQMFSERSGEDNSAGSVLPDAVYERNMLLEDKCDLKLSLIGRTKNEITGTVGKEIQAGSGDFQLINASLDDTASMAVSGYLYNLGDMGIDFEKPWWDQGTYSMRINDKVYFMNGSWNYGDDNMTWAMLFNKDAYKDLNLDKDPYQMVIDGEWTLAKFESIIKDYSWDSSGDTKFDQEDTYGFLSTPHYSTAFYFGSDLVYTKYDGRTTATPALAEKNVMDKASKLVDQVKRIYKENNTTYRAGDFSIAYEMFTAKRGLFYGEIVSYVINCNSTMEGAFGVLPVPKYDEKQKDHISYVNAWAATMSVPSTTKNPEKIGTILTVLSALSHQTVYPTYYEVVLTTRSVRDEQSRKMLDIVFENRVYDLAMYFKDLKQSTLFEDATENSGQLASGFRRSRTSFNNAWKKMVAEFT